jgi:PAS domain S-box-containing protein
VKRRRSAKPRGPRTVKGLDLRKRSGRQHRPEPTAQKEDLVRARVEAEQALRRSYELFDAAPIGYVVIDAQGKMHELNLQAARMLREPRRELAGRRLAQYVSPRGRPRFEEFLARQFQEHEPSAADACEVVLPGDKGKGVDVHVVGSTLDEHRILLALDDVTARKRAEAALLEEARRKDDFIAALSHELRNPLSPIRTCVEVLRRVEPGGASARDALDVIARQVEHLSRIVDDLLDVTRIARGTMPLERKPLDLGELVRHAVADHRSGFEAQGIALAEIAESGRVWVDGDGVRLQQVVGNLLANAMKFTPRGGRVEVRLGNDGRSAVLSISDSGVGIAPEMREFVFEPFVQAPQSLDRSRGGLGLGLATVKGLVELHSGRVDVTSPGVGRGSTFTVRLPLTRAPAVEAAPSSPRLVAPHHRVLVIEDMVEAAEALRTLLALEGHEARTAYDGASALALARDFHPDVVLCDIGLPDMDGYEIARAIRGDTVLKDVYLIALTGYGQLGDKERAQAAGFDHHLTKPPDFDALSAILAAVPLSRAIA